MTSPSESSSDLQLVLTDLKKSLEGIHSAFGVYNNCVEKLLERPSPFPTFQKDVDAFSAAIEKHERHQQEVFKGIKDGFEHDIRKEIELALRDTLYNVIKEEAEKIVKEEVDKHIEDHLPISLREQADESAKQLEKIKISLKNSQARGQNSYRERTHLDDRLDPVLMMNGEKSPHYPPTMKRLFGYDLDKARELSKDYGLTDSEDVRTHFQQFLKHIGTSVDVVIPGDVDLDDLDN